MTLLSPEQQILDNFGHQTRGAKEQILSAAIRDPKASGPLIIALRKALMEEPDYGYLQHGKGGPGPFRTERVMVRSHGAGRWQAHFEGRWREVHIQVRRTFIVYLQHRITIQINGV